MDQLLDILNEINSDVDYEVWYSYRWWYIQLIWYIVSLVGELNGIWRDITSWYKYRTLIQQSYVEMIQRLQD